MIVSRAHVPQVPRLAAILWAATRAASGRPCARSRSDDLWLLTRETWRGRARVARRRGRVVGFLLRDRTRVHALFVAAEWRGQSVGRALLADAQAEAAALDLWVLEDNRRARAFYRQVGFVETAHAQGGGNDEGLRDIRMVWTREEAGA